MAACESPRIPGAHFGVTGAAFPSPQRDPSLCGSESGVDNEEGERRVGGGSKPKWFLESIQLENFKSYKGSVTVGPFQPFVAILGPNGSGKSNLMDAISFVMGERTSSLRVRRMNELIYGATVGKPVASKASVTAVFKEIQNGVQTDTSKMIQFTRVIRGSGCEYVINQEVVNQQKYFDELKGIGINAKAKNFLVFQGAVESIAMKNSKERCALLEEISGSNDLKAEYETKKTEAMEAQRKIEAAYLEKKSVTLERKAIKADLNEAKLYNDLVQDMTAKETELCVFKIYHTNELLEKHVGELDKMGKDLEDLNASKQRIDMEWKEKKKERGELTREMGIEEKSLNQTEQLKRKELPKKIEISQKIQHLEKKLKDVEKSLQQAKDNKENQKQDLHLLKRQLKEAKSNEKKFLEEHKEVLAAKGVDVVLQESQMQEYWDLKQQVLRSTTDEKKKLETLEKKMKDETEVYNSLCRQKAELESKMDLIDKEISHRKDLAKKLYERVEDLKLQVKNKENEVKTLDHEVTVAEEQVGKLSEEYEKISSEIEAVRVNKYEDANNKRKEQTLLTLKEHFKGVKGRISSLCTITHPKYRIAVTKVVGGRMDAIVVDTEKTARSCLQYLKEQMIGSEVFLALDLIEVQPLRTRYRNENQEIFLAFDMMQFKREIEKAVLFCVGNTVVCNSSEMAGQIASGEKFGDATNAVTLDGTLYTSSGLISGGTADLEKKARKWNDSVTSKNEQRKVQIQEELKEATKSTRKRAQLDILVQELSALKHRLKYADEDFKKQLKNAEQLNKTQQDLQAQLDSIETRWSTGKDATTEMTAAIKKVHQSMNEVEDKVFRQFCDQISIPNIRTYEERDIRAHEEFNNQKEDFKQKVQQLELKIEFGSDQKNIANKNVERWNGVLTNLQNDIENCKREKSIVDSSLTKITDKLTRVQEKINDMKKSIDCKNKEVTTLHKTLVATEKKLLSTQTSITRLQASIQQEKTKLHNMYKHCKLTGIKIPLKQGSLNDIQMGDVVSSNTDTSITEEDNDDDIQRVVVDFGSLKEELKELTGPEIQKAEESLEQELREVEAKIARIQAPNKNADEKWDAILTKFREKQAEFDEICKAGKAAQDAFSKVKKERLDRFMKCYEEISHNIEGIYKGLTQSTSAQAVLGLENPEEPYLDGINYHCVAPGKRFQPMSNLSGGEKTLAALALLFAVQTFEPAPFLVLDEIDAALDNTNIGKVCSFIKRNTAKLQVLVISLKHEFFEHANALVGVTPDVEEQEIECLSSRLYTLDLDAYNE